MVVVGVVFTWGLELLSATCLTTCFLSRDPLPSRAPLPRDRGLGQRLEQGGDCPSQGVLFWACGDRVWCLFLKKIESEPLFIAGGHSYRQEMDGV